MPAPQRSPSVRTRDRGLFLLEVLIAGFILAVAGTGLAAALVQAKPLNQGPREDYAAWNAIRAIRARLVSVPFPEAAATYHLQGFDVAGLEVVAGDADGLPGEIEFDYGIGGDTRYYSVAVRVRWRGVSGDRTAASQVLLSNVRGDAGVVPTLEDVVNGLTDAADDATDTVDDVVDDPTDPIDDLVGGIG